MKEQHCGRFDHHPPHTFVAVQRVVVKSCTCNDRVCSCSTMDPVYTRAPKKERFSCKGSMVRSTEVPVTTEVKA